MYKILGSDGQEYGPLTVEQIKRWLAENRLERKTPVMPDGAKDWVFLESVPELAALFAPPTPTPAAGPPPLPASATTNSGINVLIPYKNPKALTAYYLGVFSVIPFFGIVLGLAAVVLGVMGLRYRREHPTAGGPVHAWIGIVAGGLFGFLWLALTILMIIAIGKAQQHR